MNRYYCTCEFPSDDLYEDEEVSYYPTMFTDFVVYADTYYEALTHALSIINDMSFRDILSSFTIKEKN